MSEILYGKLVINGFLIVYCLLYLNTHTKITLTEFWCLSSFTLGNLFFSVILNIMLYLNRCTVDLLHIFFFLEYLIDRAYDFISSIFDKELASYLLLSHFLSLYPGRQPRQVPSVMWQRPSWQFWGHSVEQFSP